MRSTDRCLADSLIIIASQMPNLEPGSTPIAFGNWKQVYNLATRRATTMTVDPSTVQWCSLFRFEACAGGATIVQMPRDCCGFGKRARSRLLKLPSSMQNGIGDSGIVTFIRPQNVEQRKRHKASICPGNRAENEAKPKHHSPPACHARGRSVAAEPHQGRRKSRECDKRTRY